MVNFTTHYDEQQQQQQREAFWGLDIQHGQAVFNRHQCLLELSSVLA